LWDALEQGCKRAFALWHRRAGKDEVCLHRAAVSVLERPATYWHMLPEAAQARKAIWEAVNPHTGIRRIDEAFPMAIRETTREQEMLIRFKGGGTWQVVGSDNYNSLVGSPPVGVVFSEFALANPNSWAYIRPILAENDGWALFVTTPRGRNHAHKMALSAEKSDHWFYQRLTVDQTNVFSHSTLAEELSEFQEQFGEEAGRSFYEQEYYCSFDAAILGAVYGAQLSRMEKQARIRQVDIDPSLPIHTAWDLGLSDATAIWFFQALYNEVRLIDYEEAHHERIEDYAKILMEKGYQYGNHYLPHDGNNKLLAAGGRSIVEQLWECGVKAQTVSATTQANQIAAARKVLDFCWIDRDRCFDGLEAIKQYQFEYDEARKMFRDTPRHDWTSHAADALEIMAQVVQNPRELLPKEKPKFLHELTADEVFWPKNQPKPIISDRI
jgi:hypothetical protein